MGPESRRRDGRVRRFDLGIIGHDVTLYALARPLLFRLSADRAHGLARVALRHAGVWRLLGRRVSGPRLARTVAGLTLDNPIGLAPGLDKDGQFVGALDRLGFGYLVVGSITREARPGNPFPRLVRYPERQAIANSMGLPGLGLEAAVATLGRRPRTAAKVIASVAGFTKDELVECAVAVEPHVDAVEIGLICPNSKPEERLEELQIFTALTTELAKRIAKPLFIKLPPYFDDVNRARAMAMLDVCLDTGIAGVCLQGNGRTVEPRLGAGQGSLAGRPALPDTLRIVGDVAARARGRIAIRASGGIFTGEDALQVLRAGADAVEFYTAFIYRGWNAAPLICDELAVAMARAGVKTQGDLHRAAEAPR